MSKGRLSALPREFFVTDTTAVAANLLGHYLLRRTPDGVAGGIVVETEAYLKDDPACHSFKGPRDRNRSMFGPPGHAYVYLIYGYHYCVNAVCQPVGCGEAVLLRAITVEFGEKWMRANRPVKTGAKSGLHLLTAGPARLCEALAIDRTLDGADLCDGGSELFLANNPDHADFVMRYGPVVSGPRIGITKAADEPWRFYLKNSPFISRGARRRG